MRPYLFLPFVREAEVLDWETINLAAVSRVLLPAYVLEGGGV